MRIFLFLTVVITSMGVLVSGHIHWLNKIALAGETANFSMEQSKQKKMEEKETTIARLNPVNNDSQSLLDYLKYMALTKEEINISVIGSNGVAGTGASHPLKTWTALLEKGLREEIPEMKKLNMSVHGYEGYTTADFLTGDRVSNLLSNTPDLILIELAVMNNYVQSLSVEQTITDIVNLVSSLEKGIPNAKVILLSPNPIINSKEVNRIGLTYEDYLKESMNIVSKNNWAYINSYDLISKKINGKNAVLADYITSNQFHLNDEGYYLWYEVIGEFFKNYSLNN